jgi:hypothetical protein
MIKMRGLRWYILVLVGLGGVVNYIDRNMVSARGMDIRQFALFGWLPFLAADLGSVVGGYLSPYLHTRVHMTLVNSRIAGIGVGAFFMSAPLSSGWSAVRSSRSCSSRWAALRTKCCRVSCMPW